MKKVIFTVMFLFLFMKPALADEVNISYTRLDGIYYNQIIDGSLDSNHVTSFHLGGRIAYCIEPGLDINTKTYTETDFSVLNLSDDIKDYIEKVGYYGYEYPGHQTDLYYIAAQELIWKAVRPDMEVSWTSGINKSGNIIDVSREKNEIESLVNSHSLIPSFSFEEFSGYLSDEIILNDINGVLDNYDISESKFHTIIKEGNTLKIKLSDNKTDDEIITLKRKHYDSMPLIVYYKKDSQTLAALRITNEKDVSFKIISKEKPIIEEVVDVPNTGVNGDVAGCVLLIVLGIGMIVCAIEIS